MPRLFLMHWRKQMESSCGEREEEREEKKKKFSHFQL